MGSGRGRRNCGDYCEKFARFLVIGINVIFLCLSIVVVVFASELVSYVKTLSDNADLEQAILNDLNVFVVALILCVSAGLIFITAVSGIVGAWKEWRKCLVFYACMMFIILCIQLAMGVYLNQLDPASVTARWHMAAPATRGAIQEFLTCCGWERVSDTAPFPDCRYPDWGTNIVANCQYEAEQYIKAHIKPVALAAMSIASLEFVSMFATCGLIYSNKNLNPVDEFFGTNN